MCVTQTGTRECFRSTLPASDRVLEWHIQRLWRSRRGLLPGGSQSEWLVADYSVVVVSWYCHYCVLCGVVMVDGNTATGSSLANFRCYETVQQLDPVRSLLWDMGYIRCPISTLPLPSISPSQSASFLCFDLHHTTRSSRSPPSDHLAAALASCISISSSQSVA